MSAIIKNAKITKSNGRNFNVHYYGNKSKDTTISADMFKDITFKECIFCYFKFASVEFESVSFIDCEFCDIIFNKCYFNNIIFNRCIIHYSAIRSSMIKCKFENINLIACKINNIHFENCEFSNIQCKRSRSPRQYKYVIFWGCDFDGIKVFDSNFTNAVFHGGLFDIREYSNIALRKDSIMTNKSQIGWKLLNVAKYEKRFGGGIYLLCKLQIPANATKVAPISDDILSYSEDKSYEIIPIKKYRCDRCKVLGFYTVKEEGRNFVIDEELPIKSAVNTGVFSGIPDTLYAKNKYVRADSIDQNIFNTCSHGIHFFKSVFDLSVWANKHLCVANITKEYFDKYVLQDIQKYTITLDLEENDAR